MSRRQSRRLSPEERELWRSVADTARPLRADPPLLPEADLSPPQPAPAGHPVPPRKRSPQFSIGSALPPRDGYDLQPSLTDRLKSAPLQMDRKAHQRMTRGRLAPEARIDLHGMTLAQAHPALVRFLLAATAHGRRLVLVITGKGRAGSDDGPIPQRPGALKHQVPLWLHQAPLGPLVLQVTEAHIRHGGAGAYYVYLRRAR
jgi:DNA-nicking Smr family endonuclease